MLDGVSVLVPYRPDGGYRQAAWEGVVRDTWGQSGAELIVQSPGPGAHPGEFNHPAAINAAAASASHELLIVADADCLWTPTDLPALLVEAVQGGAHWAMARRYAQLTVTQSRRLVKRSAPPSEVLLQRAQWVGDSVSWAGLICVRAKDFAEVGGYDERWAWWGADDVAFGLSMETLVGPHVRVPGSILHLWHPTPLAHNYGHERHPEQYALGERYKAAAGDREAMLQVRFG